MCGLSGIVSRQPSTDIKNIAISMSERSKHRGPDDSDYFVNERVAFAFNRLAIQDLSSNARQPMTADGCTLIFNGEIYNFRTLRDELIKLGYEFRSTSDSEVLLNGYLEWGRDVLSKIRGMFAFVLYDKKKEIIFGARDLFGEKPLHYIWNQEKFSFASEIKSFKSTDFMGDISYVNIGFYLKKGFFKKGTTIYENILEIGPAECFTLDIRKWDLSIESYANGGVELRETSKFNHFDAIDEFEEIFTSSINERLVADVSIGLLLSSGIDSTLTGLYASKYSNDKLSAYTISHDGENDESRDAAKIAKRLGVKHYVIPMNIKSPQQVFDNLAHIYDQPNGDPSSILTAEIFRACSKHHKVVLTGDGADELFCGYKDIIGYLIKAKSPLNGKHMSEKSLGRFNSGYNSKSQFVRNLSYLATSLVFDSYAYEESIYAKGWNQSIRKIYFRDSSWKNTGQNTHEEEEKRNYLSSSLSDINYHLKGTMDRLTQDYLIKVDRASMVSSVEARTPFLDPRILSLVSDLSLKIIVNHERKSIPKTLLRRNLDRSFIKRKKLGFSPPLAMWLRDKEFNNWAKKLLKNKKLIAYELMKTQHLEQLFEKQGKGYDETTRLWRLIALNHWDSKNKEITLDY